MLKNKKILLILLLIVSLGTLFILLPEKQEDTRSAVLSVTDTTTTNDDCFSDDFVLQEADSITNSASKLWWVNSGAMVRGIEGECNTVQGELVSNDKWRLLYAKNNPVDTDNGYHPQNLLRLIRTNLYKNVFQEVDFKVVKDNLSASPNRNASNGVLFFLRYLNSDNLYYAGLRVDGEAIIKKKLAGKYATLSQAKLFSGTYNRTSNPNLLPHNQWIGMRAEVVNSASGSVIIRLYVDSNQSGVWKKVLTVEDKTNPILGYGYSGIRGDFMDLKLRNYVQRGFAL